MNHDKRAITTIYNTDKYTVDLGLVQPFTVDGDITWSGGDTQLSNELYNLVQTLSTDWAPRDEWNITAEQFALSADEWNQYGLLLQELLGANSDDGQSIVISLSSAEWNQAYDTLQDKEAVWDAAYTIASDAADTTNNLTDTFESAASVWDDVSTVVANNSSDWFNHDEITALQNKADWDYAAGTIREWTQPRDKSADWSDTFTVVSSLSDSWTEGGIASDETADIRTIISTTSGEWNATRDVVNDKSIDWSSVYTHINNLSSYGFATLDSSGKIASQFVPDLSITDTYTTNYNSGVKTLCNTESIQRGDIIVVVYDEHLLIATEDEPTGVYLKDEGTGEETFSGFSKLLFPTDYIRSINNKSGLSVTLNPQDINDTNSDLKWLRDNQTQYWNDATLTLESLSGIWNETYDWFQVDSPTNNTEYNRTTFVNVSGDTIDGDLSITENTTIGGDASIGGNVSAAGDITLFGNLYTDEISVSSVSAATIAVDSDVSIGGDLTSSGITDINVLIVSGDTYHQSPYNQFNSIFVNNHVEIAGTLSVNEVQGDILPTDYGVYNVGASDQQWHEMYALSGFFENNVITNLEIPGIVRVHGKDVNYEVVSETIPHPEFGYRVEFVENEEVLVPIEDGETLTTYLTSLTASSAGLIVSGSPIGLSGDQIFPDVQIDGDVAIQGALSAAGGAIFDSLTAKFLDTQYKSLTVKEGDLTVIDGNIIQSGGTFRVEGDISHIDDENTYIRMIEDQMTFATHDIPMLRLSEYPSLDDVIILGDWQNTVDIRLATIADPYNIYVDGPTGNIGIGTSAPTVKLDMVSGEFQMPSGFAGGGLMIPSGNTATRVSKSGSIRYNTDLNTYEGYIESEQAWTAMGAKLNQIADADGDTYLTLDSRVEYGNSDTASIFTAGCSGLTVYPNQTVAFAGDIRFDSIPVYKTADVTSDRKPYIDVTTEDFIIIEVNGKQRAIRLWDIPENVEFQQTIQTFNSEDIVDIGEVNCTTGLYARKPVETFGSSESYSRQPRADDTDGDGLVDAIDPDDDNDGIPDYTDPTHPGNIDENGAPIYDDTDDDGILDQGDPDIDGDGIPNEQDANPYTLPDDVGDELDYDGDDIRNEYDDGYISNTGKWGLATDPKWQEIDIIWANLSGSA